MKCCMRLTAICHLQHGFFPWYQNFSTLVIGGFRGRGTNAHEASAHEAEFWRCVAPVSRGSVEFEKCDSGSVDEGRKDRLCRGEEVRQHTPHIFIGPDRAPHTDGYVTHNTVYVVYVGSISAHPAARSEYRRPQGLPSYYRLISLKI